MTAQIKCLHDAVQPLEAFIPHPKNPNRHPSSQLALLGNIILQQGWRSAIVVSKRSGFVIKGHGRLAAAKAAGLAEAPIAWQDYANEAEEWADMIADNRIAELSERDSDAVLQLAREIQDDSDLPVMVTGFTDVQIQDMLLAAPRNENDQEDITPGEGQSAPGRIGRVLRFGKESFPLTDQEYESLVEALRLFKEKNSSTFGFIASLLELPHP